MPTPKLGPIATTNSLDPENAGGLGFDELLALPTGRYVSSVIIADDRISAVEYFAEYTLWNANGSVRTRFDVAVRHEFDFQTLRLGDPTQTNIGSDRFVAVWDEMRRNASRAPDWDWGVRLQIFDQNGAKVGSAIPVNTTVAGDQENPVVTTLGDASFVVCWQQSPNGDATDVPVNLRAQLFSTSGTRIGGEISVNTTTTTGFETAQTVVALGGGGFVVVWRDDSESGGDTSGSAVRAQRFSASGGKLGGEILVNTTTINDQQDHQVVALTNGGFVVAWTDFSATGDDTSSRAIRAQFFSSTGDRVGGEVLVNTATAGGQASPHVALLDDGNAVISWTDLGPVNDLAKAQIFSPTGSKIGGEILLGPSDSAQQGSTYVLALSDGNFLGFWSSDAGSDVVVFGQLFDANGGKIGDPFEVDHAGSFGTDFSFMTDAVELADGRVAVSVHEHEEFEFDSNYQRIIDPRQGAVNVAGTAADDDLIGTDFADIISGGARGNDRLDGGAGADRLIGGLGNDLFLVDDPGDVIVDGSNQGTDTVVAHITYALPAAAHVERLTTSSGGGTSAIDLTGNGFDNTLIGNAAANRLTGNAGNDFLNGAAGADRLTGGAGNDTYFVDNRHDVVTELGGGGFDLINSTLTLTLVNHVDDLTLSGGARINGYGNGLSNVLTGNAAANLLSGLGANDGLIGNAGADNLLGGAGNDRLIGGVGSDRLTGGQGNDRFLFDARLNERSNVDRVMDFSTAFDTIDIDNAVFRTVGTQGAFLAADAFHIGPAAADAEDRIIYNRANGGLYYDADGLGGAAQVKFAQLADHLTLTRSDFFIV